MGVARAPRWGAMCWPVVLSFCLLADCRAGHFVVALAWQASEVSHRWSGPRACPASFLSVSDVKEPRLSLFGTTLMLFSGSSEVSSLFCGPHQDPTAEKDPNQFEVVSWGWVSSETSRALIGQLLLSTSLRTNNGKVFPIRAPRCWCGSS